MPKVTSEFVEKAMLDFEQALLRYAQGYVYDAERAKDIVQDTFIRLTQQEITKVEKGLKAWLYTVCRNRALDFLRKERRSTLVDQEVLNQFEDGKVNPHQYLDRDERLTQVSKAMNSLNEKQREVIKLKLEHGLSYKEISEITDLTVSNVGFTLHNALKKLREHLPTDLLETL